jgi:hypothetical protein
MERKVTDIIWHRLFPKRKHVAALNEENGEECTTASWLNSR